MPNTHGFVNLTHATAWDVDAYNCVGVYSSGDLDNGVLVTLGNIDRDQTTNYLNQYVFTVTPASQASTSVWIVKTPPVGSTIEQQIMDDPRYFYNEAGRPLSLAYLMPNVDCIEVTKECFADSTLPTATNLYVQIGAGGKMSATNSAPGSGAYFTFLGYHTISIGSEEVQTAVLRCTRN